MERAGDFSSPRRSGLNRWRARRSNQHRSQFTPLAPSEATRQHHQHGTAPHARADARSAGQTKENAGRTAVVFQASRARP